MDELIFYAEWSWTIEEYHRGIKQFVGIERAQVRSAALKEIISVSESLSENRKNHTGTVGEAKLFIVCDTCLFGTTSYASPTA